MKVRLINMTLLCVFSIMIDYRFFPGEGGMPGFTLTEVFSYGILAIYFARLALNLTSSEENFKNIYLKNKIIFWYFGWIFLSALLGIIFLSSFEAFWLFKDSIPSLLIYYFVVMYVKDMGHLKKLMYVYVLGATVGFVIGFFQGHFGYIYPVEANIGTGFKMDPSGFAITGNIVRGFATHPNGFAVFYVPAVIFIILAIYKKVYKDLTMNLFLLALLPLIAYDYIFSYAKGAIGWLLVGIVFLFLPKKLGKYRYTLGWISITGGVFFIIFYSVNAFIHYGGSLGTVLTRIQLWMAGIEAIKMNRPILVLGNGGATVLSISEQYAGIEYPNTHNGIFNLLIFYGLPALFFFIQMFAVSLKKISNELLRAENDLKPIGLFAFSSLVSLFGIYFFEPLIVGVNMQAHFFLVLAVSIKFFEFNNLYLHT